MHGAALCATRRKPNSAKTEVPTVGWVLLRQLKMVNQVPVEPIEATTSDLEHQRNGDAL